MKAPSVKPVRCAIYTRVSTEHGLDQEFNSLDAQYDAASVDSASRPGVSGVPVIRRSWGNHMFEDGGAAVRPDSATRFIGVYSGRLHSNDPNDPQLARVWSKALLEEVVQVPTRDALES